LEGKKKRLEGREEKRNKGKERNSKKRKVNRWDENNNFMDNFVNETAMCYKIHGTVHHLHETVQMISSETFVIVIIIIVI